MRESRVLSRIMGLMAGLVRPGPLPFTGFSVYRDTAPALGHRVEGAPSRRERRATWLQMVHDAKTTKAKLPWHKAGGTMSGDHGRLPEQAKSFLRASKVLALR